MSIGGGAAGGDTDTPAVTCECSTTPRLGADKSCSKHKTYFPELGKVMAPDSP
jgi:hypothetical protein